MAIFRQYNIQVLPLDGRRTDEIGAEGYKKLFEVFSENTTLGYQNKVIDKQAMPLINDSFICPFVVHPYEKFASGSFVKYHKAETVTELYTAKELFVAQEGTTPISNQVYFKFVFDYEFHRFAIEEGAGKLPSAAITLKTLEHFLKGIAESYFPQHTLKINLVSDPESLRDALKAGNEFGVIDLKLTFPNSHKLNAQLKELKSCNTHNVSAHLAPERGARMPDIPNYFKALLKAAPDFGNAKITFFTKVKETSNHFVKKIYSTFDTPRTFNLRQKKNETEEDFITRIWRNLRDHARK